MMQANGVKPDTTTLSTLLPGMVAARWWDCVLILAREALAQSRKHEAPEASLNNALLQMQTEGSMFAAELRELMRAAGVPLSCRIERCPNSTVVAQRQQPSGCGTELWRRR